MIYVLSEGKHNNLHLLFYLGSKKNKLLKINLMAFPSEGKAYIMGGSFGVLDYSYWNCEKILSKIRQDLSEKFDFVLVERTNNDLMLPDITTAELLESLPNGEMTELVNVSD